MQPNQLWPKPEVAKSLLEKAMMEFTGGANLNAAMGRFISKDDVVEVEGEPKQRAEGHVLVARRVRKGEITVELTPPNPAK